MNETKTENDTKAKLLSFIRRLESPDYDYKYNYRYKDKDLYLAIFIEGKLLCGIGYETYTQYKEFIDETLKEVLQKRHENEIAESWIVAGLLRHIPIEALLRKEIPYDVYKKARFYYVSKYDLEEQDRFLEVPHWECDRDILYQEALKHATEEHKAIARKLGWKG